MPPYQNENLHDMHGLLKQLDTLNSAHAPEHLEVGITDYITDTLKGAAKKASDTYNTQVKGLDLAKEKQWKDYTTVDPKIIVIENTFIDIIGALRKDGQDEWTVEDVDALKKTIQGNSKTKVLLERNIVPQPTVKATTHRPKK